MCMALVYNKARNVSLDGNSMKGSYLGPEFTDYEIESELNHVDSFQKLLKKT